VDDLRAFSAADYAAGLMGIEKIAHTTENTDAD
jgi:hypothetical protein